MILISLFAAFCLLFLLIGLRTFAVYTRAQRLKQLELRPNCLLTRAPLVFVTGRRSLLYFLNYWNEIPEFLREHGYQVQVCSLPWRGFDSRYSALSSFIEKQPRPIHLIADATSKFEVEKLLLTQRSRLASVGFAEEITGTSTLPHAIGLRSDKSWSTESHYLDHAIELAETEHS